MTRLLVHVEGATEERFVAEVLAPHLHDRGFAAVAPRLMGAPRERRRRGGIGSWDSERRAIVRRLREDRGLVVATMADYYGMPATGGRAWPGRAAAEGLGSAAARGEAVERALVASVGEAMGPGFDPARFAPYVAMHEFEALLFSDCARFAAGIGRPGLESAFQAIRDAFPNPEEIDDSPAAAPSKRILALAPGYGKPIDGTLAALDIGLAPMRDACPRFAGWLERLEARASAAGIGDGQGASGPV